MFFKIIDFKSAGAGAIFLFTVFLLGILWSSVNYSGLADTLAK